VFSGMVVEEYHVHRSSNGVYQSQIILPVVPRPDWVCDTTANGKHVLSDWHMCVTDCIMRT